jgi:hypothetical protein
MKPPQVIGAINQERKNNMKQKFKAKSLACWLIFGAVAISTLSAAPPPDHERDSQYRHDDMQERLAKYAAAGDEGGLRVLM